MRLFFAVCFLLTASSEGLCSVRVQPIPESQERPRITIVLNGTPVQGAMVRIEREYNKEYNDSRNHKMLRAKLLTDKRGQVLLPKLSFGTYCMFASAKPHLKATLYLNFSPGDVGKDGLFSMELQSFPSREQVLALDKTLPVTRVTAFRGVIQDSSGAPIPKASIQIMNMGVQGKRPTIRPRSNAQGEFADRLPDGEYVVSFVASGFKSRTLHILKSETDGANELDIKLQVGDATQ